MTRIGLFLILSGLLIPLHLPALKKTGPLKRDKKDTSHKNIFHTINTIKKEITHLAKYFPTKKNVYFGFVPFDSRIKLQWPVRGKIIATFGIGSNWINNGITIQSPTPQKIYATAPGTVSFLQ